MASQPEPNPWLEGYCLAGISKEPIYSKGKKKKETEKKTKETEKKRKEEGSIISLQTTLQRPALGRRQGAQTPAKK